MEGGLSTHGRVADQIAELKRRYRRELARSELSRDLAVSYSIATLQDATIPAAEGRSRSTQP